MNRQPRPAMVCLPGTKTKSDWIITQISALAFFGNGSSDMDKAELLTDYYIHHLDGQDCYDMGGES